MQKVKKKKLKVKRFFSFLILILFLFLVIAILFNFKIKNIYISGNKILSDDEILKISGISLDDKFIISSNILTEMKMKKHQIIEDVEIKKEFFGVIRIKVKELKPYFIINNDIVVFETNKQYKDKEMAKKLEIPPLTTNLNNDLFLELIDSFKDVDAHLITKVSQIEYIPSTLDKERFLFMMRDGNYSYVSLNNIENINYYNKIVPKLEGKKGIINFDSYRKNDAGITITIIE